jgi:beta-glucanase (GH16 family)
MKNISEPWILLLSLGILVASCKAKESTATGGNELQLVWQDEFEYSGLPDSTRWSYDTAGNSTGWGNNELQFYTSHRKENAEVDNGTLKIRALLENFQNRKYTSSRLVTRHKGDWLYGRVEVRARLPRGIGCWPAIWMLPTDWEYGGWPDSGEIDIMEQVGFNPDTVFASVHTQSYNHVIGTQKSMGTRVRDLADRFHVFAIEWDKDSIRTYLDQTKYFSFPNEGTGYKEWPFDKRFHLILNIAVGGNWGGMKGVDDNGLPYLMEVDYVRVYQP